MDKYVTRTTSRRATKRNFPKMNEDEVELVMVYEKKLDSKNRPKSTPKKSTFKRCDSITEAENERKNQIVTRSNSQKRKKLEPGVSPIKPFELLETVEESKANSSQFSNSTNENLSIYDLSLDFGNKSWADIVFEEEQEKLIGTLPSVLEKPKNDGNRKEKEKSTPKCKRQPPKRLLNAGGKRQASNFKTPPASPAASKKLPPKSPAASKKLPLASPASKNVSSKSSAASKNFPPAFPASKNLPLKAEASKNFPPKSAAASKNFPPASPASKNLPLKAEASKNVPPKSTAASKNLPPKSSAAEKSKNSADNLTWRKKPLIDEDSQNTLTEAEQLKNPPIFQSAANRKRASASGDQSKSTVLDDETNTQSSFTALLERPRRSTGPPKRFPNPEIWVEPKNGWEEDPVILERREKDLSKGKNSEVYKQYVATIEKKDRIKGVHPKTPNKFLKVTRRSWDTQVRVWRRLLYHALEMDVPSDVSSLASSNCSETGSEHDINDLKLENISDIEDFDDETKTLKASEAMSIDGPTDFAVLTTVN